MSDISRPKVKKKKIHPRQIEARIKILISPLLTAKIKIKDETAVKIKYRKSKINDEKE